jgi:hypothetical protein
MPQTYLIVVDENYTKADFVYYVYLKALDQVRSDNLLLTGQILYQLSY